MFSKKTQNGQRKSLMAGASVLAAAAAAMTGTPAMAQDTDAEEDVIVVTGSRVARRDYVANSPITTVGEEELSLSGVAVGGKLAERVAAGGSGSERDIQQPGPERSGHSRSARVGASAHPWFWSMAAACRRRTRTGSWI